jgi:hypothetical protein
VGAIVAAAVLIRRLEVFDVGALLGTYVRLGVAGLAMGSAVFAVGWWFHTYDGPVLLAGAAAAALAGLVVYPAALLVLRVPEMSDLLSWVRRRFPAAG